MVIVETSGPVCETTTLAPKVSHDVERIPKLMKYTELFFCPGEVFSQVWLRRNDETVFLTGFCVANCRDQLISLLPINGNGGEESKSELAQDLLLQQLQRIFEPSNSEDKVFLNPTSPTCSSFALHDWSEDEFTLGIYSSPSVGSGCFVSATSCNSHGSP